MSKEKASSQDTIYNPRKNQLALLNNNLLSAILHKYNSIQFVNLKNYNDYRLLLYTLGSIEVMEYTLNQDKHTLEEKIFIILNWQILGASQEQLSLNFTHTHPNLAQLSFAEKVGQGKRTWCDRLPISHSLTLDELIDNWPTKLNYIKETSINLKEVILDIYNQTKCISEDS